MTRHFYLAMAMLFAFGVAGRAQNNWMQYLPDDAYLTDLSIPGTHDSGTGYEFNSYFIVSASTMASTAQTQTLKLEEQLSLGIRAFDLRPYVSSNKLIVAHGIATTKLDFGDAIRKLCSFLEENPSEFIVVHMLYAYKIENNQSKYESLLNTLLASDEVKDYLMEFRNDLTVKDMRGKMLLISRDGINRSNVSAYKGGLFNGWGDGVYWDISISGNSSSATLNVQDISNVYQKNDEKAAAIHVLLNNSTRRNDQVWAFNMASGYNNEPYKISGLVNVESSAEGYKDNATRTHPVFINYLSEDHAGPTGAVLMDYVGESDGARGPELVNALIENNYRYLPMMNTENKPVTAPRYAHNTMGWTCTNSQAFHVNTWSVEGNNDGSGMVTPFYENWLGSGGRLGNGDISYTLYDCQKGLYKVTIRARLLNESGNASISGASIFANEASISITDGKSCTNGYYCDYTVVGTVAEENGTLRFGFNLKDATFNWISFNYIDVKYLGEALEATDGGFLLNPLCEKTVKEAYLQAQAAFEAESSQKTYNALAEAYQNAAPSVKAYEALAEAFDYAEAAFPKASKGASEEAIEQYNKVISTIKKRYTNGDYADGDIADVTVPQVYAALAALMQSAGEEANGEVDMTWVIINPSFEMGDLTGWNTPNTPNDTGVKRQTDDRYTASGCDGYYLFNTWNGDANGVPIQQTVNGIPNGRYRLDALVTSHNGYTVYLTANGGHNDGTVIPMDKTQFEAASYEFDVTDHTATIGSVGGVNGTGAYNANGGVWYKTDNFRLTLLKPTDVIDKVTIGEAEYTAYVTPFDADFTLTEGLQAYKVTDANTESATLEEIYTAPKGTAVILNAAPNEEEGYTIRQAKEGVPAMQGNIFMPGGTPEAVGNGENIYALGYKSQRVGFYLVANNLPVPANKGYLQIDGNPTDVKAFIPFGDDATGIEAPASEEGNGEPTVIYNLAGQRVTNPTAGIYIVNGKKVLISK